MRRDRRSCGHRRRLQRRQVALGQPELAGAQQAAHDLAAARLGQVAAKAISRGATAGAEPLAGEADAARGAARSRRLEPVLQQHERLDDLAGDRVGHADDAGLGDGGVLHQHALDLERADQVAGRLDDVVAAADEPEVAVLVARARSPVRYQPPAKQLAVALVSCR